MRVVSDDTDTVVPDRVPEPADDRVYPAPVTLHIACVVPDLRQLAVLKQNMWLIKPHDWDGKVQLHILVQRKGVTNDDLIYRHALVNLGLVTPQTAALQYPEEIELGWSDENAPPL